MGVVRAGVSWLEGHQAPLCIAALDAFSWALASISSPKQ